MRRAFGWTWKLLLVVACLVYQYGMYSAIGGGAGSLHVVLKSVPIVILAAWIMARPRSKAPWLAALLAAGFFVLLPDNHTLEIAAISGISHSAGYFFLLWYFGRTLRDGREPRVTQYSRSVHGALSPAMETFTRRLTIAWCIFFAGQLTVSALLLALAPLSAWSFFVNVLNLPLLVLMFLGQFVCRGLCHPEFPRTSPWQAFRAFARDASYSGEAGVHKP